MNSAVKVLSPNYPAAQITWARFTGHLIVMLLVFLPPVPGGAAEDAAAHGTDRPFNSDVDEQSWRSDGCLGHGFGDWLHLAPDRHCAVCAAAARDCGMAPLEHSASRALQGPSCDPAGRTTLRSRRAAFAVMLSSLMLSSLTYALYQIVTRSSFGSEMPRRVAVVATRLASNSRTAGCCRTPVLERTCGTPSGFGIDPA
jgi:hypothetical protein